eukprot:Clim_evm52s191 gene=Clim_evmTU52s191
MPRRGQQLAPARDKRDAVGLMPVKYRNTKDRTGAKESSNDTIAEPGSADLHENDIRNNKLKNRKVESEHRSDEGKQPQNDSDENESSGDESDEDLLQELAKLREAREQRTGGSGISADTRGPPVGPDGAESVGEAEDRDTSVTAINSNPLLMNSTSSAFRRERSVSVAPSVTSVHTAVSTSFGVFGSTRKRRLGDGVLLRASDSTDQSKRRRQYGNDMLKSDAHKEFMRRFIK